MERRLITAALPYVNNIPHLGNIIQDLSADVFARYCRLRGHETLYICGTDEYGTATETRALEEGVSPRELCDRYHAVHKAVYDWFEISFDNFGRTSIPQHTEITQAMFLKLHENGFIREKTMSQPFCEKCGRFLADRYVLGTCPHCGFADARGDQCESCGKLLDPQDLQGARCSVCGTGPVLKATRHLFIDLAAILPKLQAWMQSASEKGFWSRNALQMTLAWMRDGLRERCITRDLKWGIPVPLDGYRDKVFYVWFDAPIGYISITAQLTEKWKSWWQDGSVKLYQFIGKDNVPFHTVIFPSTLLGTGEPWTMLHHMSSTEYLNYEGGKFSKSRGIGVFGTDARETGIPADVWRFFIYYNRPEKSDFDFTWKDFQEKVNAELIGNLGNLVNRTLTFVGRFYGGVLPEGGSDAAFWTQVRAAEKGIEADLERVDLRDAFHKIFALSSIGNKRFQDGQPWKGVKENPAPTAALIRDLVFLVRDLAVLVGPFLPATARRIAAMLGVPSTSWEALGRPEGVGVIGKPEILFARLEDAEVEKLRIRFSGSQKEREKPDVAARFREKVDLRVARILEVKRHPDAAKLYVETVDLGTEKRQIVSGLVPHYKEEQLTGRNVILVANLKPALLRGVESNGMLLAASEGKTVEVLFVDHAQPGDAVELMPSETASVAASIAKPQIDIDTFLSMPIRVSGRAVSVDGVPLACAGKPVTAVGIETGGVR